MATETGANPPSVAEIDQCSRRTFNAKRRGDVRDLRSGSGSCRFNRADSKARPKPVLRCDDGTRRRSELCQSFRSRALSSASSFANFLWYSFTAFATASSVTLG